MAQEKYGIGMVGLGVMGRNMLLNIAKHGFAVAGYDKDPERIADLRTVAQTAIGLGIPAPGFSAALTYYDSLRAKRLPANLIQAQRDYFGAHTYERVDERGIFHTEWGQE
jgi:6-phosphogluconate dehydrogenase